MLLTVAADRLTRGRLTKRHAAQRVELREIPIEVHGWPRAFDGLRIAHVSDFHVGHLMSADRAIEAIEGMRGARPDLVVCTGDVVDLDVDCGVDRVFAALKGCEAPLGAWLVLGNHDHLDDPRRVIRLAKEAGVETLHDRIATFEAADRSGPEGVLRIGGVDWGRTISDCSERVGRLWRTVGGVDLLLAHNPKAFAGASRLGVPLVLAGHTHGGQVAIRRPRTDVSFARRLKAGLYRRGRSTLFVTVGLGAWFPLRVNCPPEIAILTVRCARD
jgi:predicted MPP superfamily phosphohydrolase